MLLLAAPALRAPDDPAERGLWALIALVLLIGLVAAHVRILRAVARQLHTQAEETASHHGQRPPQAVAHVESPDPAR